MAWNQESNSYNDRILGLEADAAQSRDEAIHEGAMAAGVRAEARDTNERLAANIALVMGHGQQEAEINAENESPSLRYH